MAALALSSCQPTPPTPMPPRPVAQPVYLVPPPARDPEESPVVQAPLPAFEDVKRDATVYVLGRDSDPDKIVELQALVHAMDVAVVELKRTHTARAAEKVRASVRRVRERLDR